MSNEANAAAGLSLALLISGAIGTKILASDEFLWTAAPTHAEGLVAFVVLDVVLAFMVLRVLKLTETGAAVLSLIQFVAMATDLTIYTPAGVPAQIFRSYLQGDVLFVALLAMQPVIACIGIGARRWASPRGPKAAASSRGGLATLWRPALS
jgi:hypothetical protein